MEIINQKRKKEEIIEVAAREFAEKGYDGANINEIAIMAGIGKGTIYLYFKTKKDLYLETIRAIVDRFNEMSEQIVSMDLNPFEKLKLVIETFFQLERESIFYLKLWSRHQFQHNPVFPEEVSKIFKDLRQPLCEIIEEGVEKGEFSTPYPTVTGYFILSLIVMLMPNLQRPNSVPLVQEEERIPFILDIVRKLLQK
ncbi:TetR/AcrR family transcriptional regulator [Geobacillus sp. YF-1]|uniref:TetR/AcrR family transcriptional regulator n=1 Tax=Geobacillus sp. YF-1 TaxID=3457480 RepID=UPI0040465C02